MCPVYFESIRVADGKVFHLDYHQRRVGRVSVVQLHEAIDRVSLPQQGVYKLRISYTPTEILRTVVTFYTPKNIETLKVVKDDDIDYSFKWEERSVLNKLYELRGDCDDILIVKHGMVTDTSFCNILFSDGLDWVTPGTPLLAGTCRARLVQEGKVRVEDIRLTELPKYKYYMLINAMLDFDLRRQKTINGVIIE